MAESLFRFSETESLDRFSETESLVPDISVLIQDRPSVNARGHMTFTPEIVVEVVSSESAEQLFQNVNGLFAV